MAALFKKIVLLLLSPECYDEFFVHFHFFHGPCLSATVSKLLGLVIISGSVIIKVPQISKIYGAKSAEGISILSVLMDLFAITSSVAYSFVKGFPISAWGEGLFLASQTAVIVALVFYYGGSTFRATVFSIAYVIILFVLVSGLTPVEVLWSMQALNVPIIVIGKFIQVVTNYKNGSTGQLSAATGFMLFFGSMARIFTSWQETGDAIMILTYISAFSVNAIIAGQLVYYWNVTTKPKPKRE